MTRTAAIQEIEPGSVMTSLQDEAVLFNLRIGQWRIRTNADRAKVDTTAKAGSYNVRKKILDSDEYRAIEKLDRDARHFVMRQSVPSPLGRGTYLLPIALVRPTMEWLKNYQDTRADLIRDFLALYPVQQESMRRTLGDLYDEDDYPEAAEVRARFWVSTLMMELHAPESLKGISGVMYETEVARLKNMWEDTGDTIRAALYDEMRDLVSGLSDRLSGKMTDGKAQALRGKALERFQEWLDVVSARNLTKDAGLEALCERGRAIVGGLEVQTIRKSPRLREELADEFTTLKRELDAAVVARPGRKIRLADEE